MSSTIPIFPLPDSVLFPRTHLRLHLFEPRYVQMLTDALEGDRQIGLAHLRPGYENDYFGAPPVYKVFCTARILFADEVPGGRWNILIEGVQRARITAEEQVSPYRVVRFTPLLEEIAAEEREATFALAHSICRRAEAVCAQFENGPRLLTNMLNVHQHPGIIADVVTCLTVSDSYARQSMLEEMNISRRLKLVGVKLDEIIVKLQEKGHEFNLPARDVE